MSTVTNTALLIWGSILLTCSSLEGQEPSIFEELGKIPSHEIQLSFNFEDLNTYRKKDESFPATLSYQTGAGNSNSWDLKLDIRGRYRRHFCDFPPLKLNFSKKDLAAMGFSKFDEIKLVTHCFEDNESDEFLFREYLAYGLYRQLTNFSYRTQLLKVTYVNSQNPSQRAIRYAFLIEDDAELAQRLRVQECKTCFAIPQDTLNKRSENLVAVFQYFIGNTDWGIANGQKNVKYFQPLSGGQMFVIPYDFDFSGFVNPGYAVPATGTNIQNVKERAFLGFNPDKKTWEGTLKLFKTKKDDFIRLIQDFPFLEISRKKELIEYINSFYIRDLARLQPDLSLN